MHGARTNVLLDANLLVLYIVGIYGTDYIGMHRRLSKYSLVHFQLLVSLLLEATSVLISHAVIIETSNLLRQTREPHRTYLTVLLAKTFQAAGSRFRLLRTNGIAILSHPRFSGYGYTDAELYQLLSDSQDVLLTDDESLYRVCCGISPSRVVYFSDFDGR